MATATVQLPRSVPSATGPHPTAYTAVPSTRPTKHDVDTVLNFFKPNEDGSGPEPAYINNPATFERPSDTHRVTIQDVSGDENIFTLDSHGFQFTRHSSEEKDFLDDDRVRDRYYKEVDQLLKVITGATRTFIFDHTIRRPSRDEGGSSGTSDDISKTATENKGSLRGPVRRVHIDQSYDAALSRVPFHLPDIAERLLQGRVQIINVWRPIKTVRRDPLAVAQSQTVSEEDLVPIGLNYPNRKGETLSVKHSNRQQWYYKWHQSPEEVLLIKCFDNRAGVQSADKYRERAKRVPHSAFEIPGTEEEEGRESIEVRCLVFHENDIEEN